LVALPEIKENQFVKQGIYKLNERTYELVYNTDNTLKTDRSYLTRLAMQEKGLNLFKENPITGVGLGNFHKTKGEIDYEFDGAELLENKDDFLSEGTSAHNSYISFLSEGGILVFIPFLFLLLYPIFYFLINFSRIEKHEKAIFISVIFMAIHSWFIVGMANVFGWFILGIVNSYIIHKRAVQTT
jgi:O-antigen ligase